MYLTVHYIFGSFGYAKMSLYNHHLSLSLSLSLSVLLLASVSVDSSPINFQNGCHLYDAIVSICCKLVANNLSDLLCSVLSCDSCM